MTMPKEIAAEINQLAHAEDRTKNAVLRRAIHLYRQQSEAALKL
jgi:predicted transcriptional regulator